MVYSDKLVGKRIAVIGGTSGIGFSAAELLLEAGAIVTVISSSPEKVSSAVERLNSSNVQGKVGNVRDEEAFTQLLISLAPLDHVVFSSVDLIIRGPLAEANLEDAKDLFGVKFWGSIVVGKGMSMPPKASGQIANTSEALVKHDIVVSGGSLTLTSGAAALRPKKGAVIGAALNAGVIALTSALADELTDKKIRVNTVIPGIVQTELWDNLGISKEKQEESFAKSAKELSVGFVATPKHIAEAYLYTIRADYANGTTITIDGGGNIRG